MKGSHHEHLELVTQQVVLGGGGGRHTEIPSRRGNRSSLVRLHESAARSTVTWREKNRGKEKRKEGSAVPSTGEARG